MRLVKRCIATSALLALALATGALAAERATVAVHAGGVDFSPGVDYAYATLTVSGNGITFSRVVERGRGLSVGTRDLENRPLPDGHYKWRLELIPNPQAARALRAAALGKGNGGPEPWTGQSGSFTISGGLVVDPNPVEPEPVREPAGVHGTAVAPPPAATIRERTGDSDAEVGDRADAEVQARSAAARARPAATLSVLQVADRVSTERSDGAATAHGGSLEAALRQTNHERPARARSSARPRSDDGTNGRPRSD